MDFKKFRFKINFKNPIILGIIISAAIFIVITGVYYYFVYSKLKIKLAHKVTAFKAVKARYDSYLLLVKTYPVLLKENEKLNKEFAALLPEMPSRKNIPQLLMTISNYEKSLALNLKMFKPGKNAAEGFYETVPFSMNISGDFYNVYKFFYKLANMKRIVDVHNVSISRVSAKNRVTVAVSFNGTAFSFTGAPPPAAKQVNKKGGVIKK